MNLVVRLTVGCLTMSRFRKPFFAVYALIVLRKICVNVINEAENTTLLLANENFSQMFNTNYLFVLFLRCTPVTVLVRIFFDGRQI